MEPAAEAAGEVGAWRTERKPGRRRMEPVLSDMLVEHVEGSWRH